MGISLQRRLLPKEEDHRTNLNYPRIAAAHLKYLLDRDLLLPRIRHLVVEFREYFHHVLI